MTRTSMKVETYTEIKLSPSRRSFNEGKGSSKHSMPYIAEQAGIDTKKLKKSSKYACHYWIR